MSDPAPDLPDVVTAPDADQSPPGRLHTLVKSPTLVPSPHPGPKEDVVGQCKQAVVDTIADSTDSANWPHGSSAGPQMAESQTEAREDDVQSEDLLKLLQQLAHRTGGKAPLPHTPAAPMDARLASYLSGIVDGLNSPDRDLEPRAQVAVRNKAPHLKWVMLAGCLAILGAATLGVFLSNRIMVVADDGQTKSALTTPSNPDSTQATQARPDRPSVPVVNQCDLPGLEADPDATYVVVTPMPLSSSGRRTSELSGEDRGWYSLMSLMARPELHSAGC